MSNNVFILKVEISAAVRQSVQIKFDDLRLPKTVIDALEKQQSVSVRPNLSGKLKEFLSVLKTEQHKLYAECTIHHGGTHFLHEDYFEDAMERIQSIRESADSFNAKLCELWYEEYTRWSNTVDNFLEPLFTDDPVALKLAKEAYLSIFPTKKEFEKPIRVFVLGPNPVFLTEAQHKDDHPLSKAIQEASLINTTEVLEAARDGAADRAYLKAAELLDDLDVRIPSKVGERQTGGTKRRGSWQLTAESLELIAKHVPGFEHLSSLASQLVEVGVKLQAESARNRDKAHKEFGEIKKNIREEMQRIVSTRHSTDGLESLKRSLSLSGTYRDLISQINEADTQEQLDALHEQIQIEKDVYEQRAKHLQSLFSQRSELITAASIGLEDILQEVKELNASTTDELDF